MVKLLVTQEICSYIESFLDKLRNQILKRAKEIALEENFNDVDYTTMEESHVQKAINELELK